MKESSQVFHIDTTLSVNLFTGPGQGVTSIGTRQELLLQFRWNNNAMLASKNGKEMFLWSSEVP